MIFKLVVNQKDNPIYEEHLTVPDNALDLKINYANTASTTSNQHLLIIENYDH